MVSVFLFILPHTPADTTYKNKPKKISSRDDRQFLAEPRIVEFCLFATLWSLWTGRWYLHFTVFIKQTLENKPNGAVSDHKIKWTLIDTSNSEKTSSINYVMHKLYELKNVTFEKSLGNKEKHSINNNILLLIYSQARVCHQLFWFRFKSSKNTCEPKLSCSSVYLINNSLANGDSSFPVCLVIVYLAYLGG